MIISLLLPIVYFLETLYYLGHPRSKMLLLAQAWSQNIEPLLTPLLKLFRSESYLENLVLLFPAHQFFGVIILELVP